MGIIVLFCFFQRIMVLEIEYVITLCEIGAGLRFESQLEEINETLTSRQKFS